MCSSNITYRVFHNLFIRHGDPVEYAQKSAALSQVGRLRSAALAEQVACIFDFSPISEYLIAIWHSDRPRTIETAEVIQASLLLIKAKLCARKIRIVKDLQHVRYMSPEKALRPLLEVGVKKKKLYRTWISAPTEYLMGKNAKTPQEIELEVLKFLTEVTAYSETSGEISPIINIIVTSETTLGALARKRFPNQDIQAIGYCEMLRATIGLVGSKGLRQIEYEFRGDTCIDNHLFEKCDPAGSRTQNTLLKRQVL